jgi:hypothetical protein
MGLRKPLSASMSKKLFVVLCVAAPFAFAIVRPIFPLSVSVAAICAGTGFLLSFVLLGWTIWNFFSHRDRALWGVGSLLVCFCFLVFVADIFAAHERRKQQSIATNAVEFSK